MGYKWDGTTFVKDTKEQDKPAPKKGKEATPEATPEE